MFTNYRRMVFQKKSQSRKRFRRRFNNRRKKAPSNRTLNKKIKKLNDMIEVKYFDSNFNTTAQVGGGAFILNDIGTSNLDTATGVIGSEILMTSLTWTGTFTTNANRLLGTEIRVMLVIDKQANQAFPAIADNPQLSGSSQAILAYSDPLGTPNASYLFNRNMLTVDRFDILHDEIIIVNPPTVWYNSLANATLSLETSKQWRGYKKLNRKVRFSYDLVPAGGGHNVITNALYFIIIGDSNTDPMFTDIMFRVNYKDA